MLFLSAIIISSVFYLKTDKIYSQIITTLLSGTLVLVMLIARDLQNLRLGGEMILIESGEKVFEFIGKPRYYNQKYLKDGSIKIPDSVKKYRVGLHSPGEKFNIKEIVKNKTL